MLIGFDCWNDIAPFLSSEYFSPSAAAFAAAAKIASSSLSSEDSACSRRAFRRDVSSLEKNFKFSLLTIWDQIN